VLADLLRAYYGSRLDWVCVFCGASWEALVSGVVPEASGEALVIWIFPEVEASGEALVDESEEVLLFGVVPEEEALGEALVFGVFPEEELEDDAGEAFVEVAPAGAGRLVSGAGNPAGKDEIISASVLWA